MVLAVAWAGLAGYWPRLWRRQPAIFRPLAIVAILYGLTGNASFQVALAAAGLAISAPVTAGGNLWGGAIAAWLLMGERITVRSGAGLCLLLAAIPLLTSGGAGGRGPIWLGVLMAFISGASFGSGNAVLRRAIVQHGLTQSEALATLSGISITILLSMALVSGGTGSFETLRLETVAWLLIAGVLGAGAIASLSKALSTMPVSRVTSISTLQTAIAACLGVVVFEEPLTFWLLVGVALSVAGSLLAQPRISTRRRDLR